MKAFLVRTQFKAAVRRLCVVTAAAALAVVAGCGQRQGRVSGVCSTGCERIAGALADAFMKQRPDTIVTFQRTDSAGVVGAVGAGVSAVGVAEFVGPAQRQKTNLIFEELARDGIGIVVNPANGITNLALAHIKGVFGGTIRDWRELGGAGGAIVLVLREEGSGTRRRFEEMMAVKSPLQSVVIQDSTGAMLTTVANDDKAIGYLMRSAWEPRVGMLSVDGVPCSPAAIQTGAYPLVTPTYLVTPESLSGAAADFADFARSAEGLAILQSFGLVVSVR